MVVFKSLIVFDTETTSLPREDHNTTKITEFAFIGCEIEHLRNCEKLPRVLHKLVILCNPNQLILPSATKVSGLSNELLENVEPLREEDIDFISHFISRLPPPVCIVAHNGERFDFPIFRRALKKLKKSLQDNVYCADALKAFQCLIPVAKKSLPRKRTCNETPENQKTQPTNILNYSKVRRKLLTDDEVSEPVSTQDGSSHKNVCTQPLPDHKNFPELVSTSDGGDARPKSYKLRDIYYFYFGEYYPDSHQAEEDSIALLKCIKSCYGFYDWMNENAVVFNSIEPLF